MHTLQIPDLDLTITLNLTLILILILTLNPIPSPGLFNLSAMAGHIDFILGVAGQYAISADGDV